MNSLGLQNKIGYKFRDEALLIKALTHSSYVHEKDGGPDKNNERLEFLGDALLDAIIGEELFRRLSGTGEGALTKLRALIVCEKSLAHQGRVIEIGNSLYLGKGEENIGGRGRDALIADAVEAVIGAVFLDGGYEAAKGVVASLFESRINEAINGKLNEDYKTELQELLQAKGEARISYALEREEGPDHDKTFYINLFCNRRLIGKGRGRSKKEAEQDAAREALERGVDYCTLKE